MKGWKAMVGQQKPERRQKGKQRSIQMNFDINIFVSKVSAVLFRRFQNSPSFFSLFQR